MCKCFQIGGPFIAEDPDCPIHGVNKCDDPENFTGDCGHECHKIGGPFIAEDPDCPVHGSQAWKNYRN
jgi:hypothetical protein